MSYEGKNWIQKSSPILPVRYRVSSPSIHTVSIKHRFSFMETSFTSFLLLGDRGVTLDNCLQGRTVQGHNGRRDQQPRQLSLQGFTRSAGIVSDNIQRRIVQIIGSVFISHHHITILGAAYAVSISIARVWKIACVRY